jgi:hypothetical protein
MTNFDGGRGLRPGSARARSLMAAASLLGLSLGVGVANAAEGGAAADQIEHPGAIGEAAASGGHSIKMDLSQTKRGSADAHHIKWTSDQIKGENRSAHTVKMDSSQVKGESTDAASHQVKLKGW